MDFETYFVPSEENLAADAVHWKLLKSALAKLQASSLH
jgi:hypothetical protein